MASVNKVFLIGYLGKDPEMKTLNNGNKLATLSMATSKTWKDRETGEKREKTTWHRVVVYNKGCAEFAEKYLKKGMMVQLWGELDTREYEKDGKTHQITEVLISAFSGELQSLEKIEGGGGIRPPAPTDENFEDMSY